MMIPASLLSPPKPLDRVGQKRVLVVALVAVVVEIGVLMGALPYLVIGRAIMPISVFVSAGVLALLGRRAFGRRTRPGHTQPFWVAATIGLGFGAVALDKSGHLIDWPGIAIAALGEEVIYRFAVPTLVAAILVSFKVSARPARIAGYSVAALWFVLLPWHRAQMTDVSQVLPFIAFAALAALVAYRSGSIAATAAVHTVLNILTVLVYAGDVSRVTRSLALGCLLVLLVLTYGVVGNRRPAQVPPVIDLTTPRGDTVIDLRDSVHLQGVEVDAESQPAGSQPPRS